MVSDSTCIGFGRAVYFSDLPKRDQSHIIYLDDFFVGVLLSFITYFSTEQKSITKGILNTVDMVSATLIMLAVIMWGKNRKTRLRPFEKYYLAGVFAVILFWIISRDPFTSNILAQIPMVIAYIPTVHTMIAERRNTESFSAWSLGLCMGLIALYPAVKGGDVLATLYAGRTVVMVAAVLAIMGHYSLAERRLRSAERKN